MYAPSQLELSDSVFDSELDSSSDEPEDSLADSEELEESEGAPSSPQAARLNTIAEASIRLITFFFIIFLLSIDFDSHTGTLYLYSSHDWIRVYNTVPYVTT